MATTLRKFWTKKNKVNPSDQHEAGKSVRYKVKEFEKQKSPESLACRRTLNTYEIVEAILLWLDRSDLRTTRLVSKSWNEVIVRSHPLNARWQITDRERPRLLRMLLLGEPQSRNSGGSALDDVFRHLLVIDRESVSNTLTGTRVSRDTPLPRRIPAGPRSFFMSETC